MALHHYLHKHITSMFFFPFFLFSWSENKNVVGKTLVMFNLTHNECSTAVSSKIEIEMRWVDDHHFPHFPFFFLLYVHINSWPACTSYMYVFIALSSWYHQKFISYHFTSNTCIQTFTLSISQRMGDGHDERVSGLPDN